MQLAVRNGRGAEMDAFMAPLTDPELYSAPRPTFGATSKQHAEVRRKSTLPRAAQGLRDVWMSQEGRILGRIRSVVMEDVAEVELESYAPSGDSDRDAWWPRKLT